MNLRSIIALGMLFALIVSIAESQMTSSGLAPSEAATPPGDTSQAWIHDSTKEVYHYSPDLSKWVGPVQVIIGGKQGANVVGALKTASVSHDTTSAEPAGLEFPYDILLMRVSAYGDSNSGAADDNFTIFNETVGDTTFIMGMGNSSRIDSIVNPPVTISANKRQIIYMTGGATHLDDPQFILHVVRVISP
jgi:hypothetical protein